MAKRIQWVNYPTEDGRIGAILVTRTDFVDKDVESVEHMGPIVYARARFRERTTGQIAHFELIPDVDNNATYSDAEKNQAPGIFTPMPPSMGPPRMARIVENGEVRFRIKLTPSGGDEFMYSVQARNEEDTLEASDSLVTRRKLFFQIIRMSKASKISVFRKRQFKERFWDTRNKLYIKLQEVSSGRKIPNRVNFDHTDGPTLTWLKNEARNRYDDFRAPYTAAIVCVNKMCAPADFFQAFPITLTTNWLAELLGNWREITIPQPLFHYCDPATDWYVGIQWVPGVGAPEAIPKARTKVKDPWTISVDMRGKTAGAGTLWFYAVVIGRTVNGFSETDDNLIVIASRSWNGKKKPAKKRLGTLIHEMGHKIGMVPGGAAGEGDKDLEGQTSYYDERGHKGPHCRTGAPLLADYATAAAVHPPPTCVMFGSDIRTSREFCPECLRSVRKMDVTPKRKQKLGEQF